MTTWATEVGADPAYWLVPVDSLPAGDAVIAHIRAQERPKVVALVGYHDDAEAGAIAKRLPYGYRGDGIEEIVFCRVGPATGEVVQFSDDAWPGEDRTYVVDEVAAALALAQQFAVEYDAQGALVVVSGRPEFVDEVGELVG
jgi:hypothetical protein